MEHKLTTGWLMGKQFPNITGVVWVSVWALFTISCASVGTNYPGTPYTDGHYAVNLPDGFSPVPKQEGPNTVTFQGPDEKTLTFTFLDGLKDAEKAMASLIKKTFVTPPESVNIVDTSHDPRPTRLRIYADQTILEEGGIKIRELNIHHLGAVAFPWGSVQMHGFWKAPGSTKADGFEGFGRQMGHTFKSIRKAGES